MFAGSYWGKFQMKAHINKNKFAAQSEEWVQLRSRVTDILLSKRTIGLVTQSIMYLIQDEIAKSKKALMK